MRREVGTLEICIFEGEQKPNLRFSRELAETTSHQELYLHSGLDTKPGIPRTTRGVTLRII
jgi:hypothetical protein